LIKYPARAERTVLTIKDLEFYFCPYCRTRSFLSFIAGATQFYHCDQCDLFFRRRDIDDEVKIEKYYEFKYFDNDAHDQREGWRNNVFDDILDLVENEKNGIGDLLDIGCGCGHFLKKAKDRGWRVSGIDPSKKSVEYAIGMIGNSIKNETISNYYSDCLFDVITLSVDRS
jgi:SAM-dependent methyltransferase